MHDNDVDSNDDFEVYWSYIGIDVNEQSYVLPAGNAYVKQTQRTVQNGDV